MDKNYKWLKRFYQDLCNKQTRYELTAEPLYFTGNHGQNRDLLQSYLELPEPKMPLDAYLEQQAPNNLIVDNDYLDTYHKDGYRTVLLDGFQDYLLNYYPEFIKDRHSYVRDLPMRCLVLVKENGAYFYALPLEGTYNVGTNAKYKMSPLPEVGEDVSLDLGANHQPVIKTTMANILHILDAVPLTKAPIQDGLAFTKNVDQIVHTSHSREVHFILDEQGNKFLAYTFLYALTRTTHMFKDSVGSYDKRSEIGLDCAYPVTGKQAYLNYHSDAARISDCNNNVKLYLTHHIKNHFDENGKIYYTLDDSNGNKTWDEILHHVGTQNVQHYLFGSLPSDTYVYQENYAYWNIFAQKDWSTMTDEHVEDLPVKSTGNMQPLTKPTGLNALLTGLKIGDKHLCFINQSNLVQLLSFDDAKSMQVRRYKLS